MQYRLDEVDELARMAEKDPHERNGFIALAALRLPFGGKSHLLYWMVRFCSRKLLLPLPLQVCVRLKGRTNATGSA
jgi:hypothetical protein